MVDKMKQPEKLGETALGIERAFTTRRQRAVVKRSTLRYSRRR
jgi:hypothetical protein